MTPAISILVPLYNKGAYVGEMIESALAQTYAHWEMIVVDGGSTDNGIAAVERFSDPRIRLIASEKTGPGMARNRALAEARGEWVQFLDADDLLEPRQLEEQIASAGEQPDADIVVGSWQEFNDGAAERKTLRPPAAAHSLKDSSIAFAPWAVHAAIVRRTAITPEFLWPEELDSLPAEDVAFWFKLVMRCRVGFNETRGALYRLATVNSRNRQDDARRWFKGVHGAIEHNLAWMRAQSLALTPGQCEHLMRIYSSVHLAASHAHDADTARESLERASGWLAEYFKRGGASRLPMLARRVLGLKLFLRLSRKETLP
jgi:glycosyltransferase involved in cell wall biosynthesis